MRRKAFHYIYFPTLAIVIMWLSKITEYLLDLDFKSSGIFPRKLEGLKGIILSPFIHGDFNHLISNTLPFFLLCTAILYFYRKSAYKIILLSWFITGISVWLGGRYAWHIGASGLVYAFASFLFFSGILSKQRELIAISLVVIFLYGGLIWGILPGNVNISWESHLFGFLSSFIIAFYIGRHEFKSIPEPDELSGEEFSDTNSTYDKEYDVFYDFKEENE